MKKKHLKKAVLCTALALSMSLFATACGSKDTASTNIDSNNITAESEDIEDESEDIEDESEDIEDEAKDSNIPVSSIFNSSEREIWYITDNIDKESSVNIVVIENGTFTKYALAGSGISLGDCAKLTDDEVVAKARENYNSYIGYDLSKMEVYLNTDSSGNKVESESLYFPISSIVSFEVLPVVDQIHDLSLDFKSAAGIVNPVFGEIYDSSYYGYSFSGEYMIKRSDSKVSLNLDGTDYSGAHLDEDIREDEYLSDGAAEDTGIQAYQSSEAIDGFKKKDDGYIAEFIDADNNYFSFENIQISDNKATYSK